KLLPPLRAGEGWGGVVWTCDTDRICREVASPHPNPPLLHVGEGADPARWKFLGTAVRFLGNDGDEGYKCGHTQGTECPLLAVQIAYQSSASSCTFNAATASRRPSMRPVPVIGYGRDG